MKERIYEIMSTITKRKDDYGNGVSLRFKDGEGNTIAIFRYSKNGGRYIMISAEVFELMEVLNEKLNFKEDDLSEVDKSIKDYCLDYITQSPSH